MSEVKPGYTRCSSIASAFAGYHKIRQEVLDRAGARGTCVHRLIEDEMNDIAISDERWTFMGDDLKGYFASWEHFYEPYKKATVIIQENRIDDDATMLTGEPDLVIMHEGKKILLDWKCSYSVGKHWQLQASGYDYLASTIGIKVDEVYFVKLDKLGKPPIVTKYVPNWTQFFAAYDLYKEFLQNQDFKLEDE